MLDDLLRPSQDQVLQVTDLTRQIKQQLEGRFTQFWVQGEISNLRRQSSGHVYFSLKDRNSQLPAVLFARDAARQGFQLEDGMEVMLFGDISVYEPHGRYQMIAKVAIQSGSGRLQIEFERLKRKLATEGLFDSDRKRPLPIFPKKIAVITSPTGAAVKDFLRILHRRACGGQVIIFPARVQGKEAAGEIRSMLEHANASDDFDLIVLTRGGGSIEDLWPFNDEALARAVAASRLPVISAVGHEIDHVLTDYAADIRAETPSGAAEIISSAFLNLRQQLQDLYESITTRAQTEVYERQITLKDLQARLKMIAPDRQLEMLHLRLDDYANKLQRHAQVRITKSQDRVRQLTDRIGRLHPKTQLGIYQQQASGLQHRIQQALTQSLDKRHRQLSYMEKRLGNSSVQATLNRGYSILRKADGSIVKHCDQVRSGDALKGSLANGEIQLTVD